jgi:histidinol phosphatase-like PHP family hydrolase
MEKIIRQLSDFPTKSNFKVMKRREFIKKTGIATGMMTAGAWLPSYKKPESFSFPLIDMHVHLTREFSIDEAMELAEKRGVKFGIVEHPASWALRNDDDLKEYINKLRKYPVYIGLQPMTPGWRASFSPALLNQLDYILMDPQTIPLGNGEFKRIWQLETYVEDIDGFMKRYMDYSLKILAEEQIDIFGWPLFLPVCIAKDYYSLWTDSRMEQLITAAGKRHIAIEINDMAQVPHERFILMAKEAGLKFTFGSDARNNNAGRLAYCKAIARKCNLKDDDFFIPGPGRV